MNGIIEKVERESTDSDLDESSKVTKFIEKTFNVLKVEIFVTIITEQRLARRVHCQI